MAASTPDWRSLFIATSSAKRGGGRRHGLAGTFLPLASIRKYVYRPSACLSNSHHALTPRQTNLRFARFLMLGFAYLCSILLGDDYLCYLPDLPMIQVVLK